MKPRLLFTLPFAVLITAAAPLCPAALSTSSSATDGSSTSSSTGPQAGHHARLQHLKEKLGLTDDQTEKVKAIFQRNRSKLAALKDLPKEERRTKLHELIRSERTEIAAILTPAQKEKLKEAFQHHRSGSGAAQ